MPRFNRNLVFNLLIAFALIVLGAVSIWAKTRLISVVMVALGIALMISGFVELIRFFIPGIHHHHGDYNGLFRSLLSIVPSVADGRVVRRIYACLCNGLSHAVVAVSSGSC